ncbi:hypothetical protein HK097_006099 [Rhizophlyctis rosea]|uniref:Ubiquitin carboxyl-terminal hydrolase n=1 Tax=Rhizophlyctis rosea TaxID=64517 RepID=A0AAD5SEH0_9FUNG|nr:hypothetical protein HK097_006099 [Rhizophlyctis rosea]
MTDCPHVSTANLQPAGPATAVHKEECTLCFDSQDLPQGIDVCLTCFNGGCLENDRNHAHLHYQKTKHPLVLNIKRVPKTKKRDGSPPPAKITKLAIEEEIEENLFDFITSVKCYACGGREVERTQGNLPAVIDSIMVALSAKRQSEVKAWQEEITTCTHTENLVQQESKPLQPQNLATCNNCDLKENLWLCLVCGNLGCGRQQFGGLGGNGHGLNHYDTTQHAVSVKLGTITAEGTADVFCYLCGDERLDPHLGKHLANFGINVASQQKTEKSLTELQVEQNMKFDFSMTTEDGKELTPLFGPGYTGLKNLGNSCYMASVVQSVFALQPFQERYLQMARDHIATCRDDPARCFHCQMAKMADGLLSGRYSQPWSNDEGETRGQDGIAPNMFKEFFGKGHPEFSTMRQQDAQEFLQHMLSIVEQKERATGTDPTSIFKFALQHRLQCLECERVGHRSENNSALTLPLLAKVIGVDENGKKQYAPVNFEEALASTLGDDIREFQCPHDQRKTQASASTRFGSFPDVLVVTLNRFILGEGWVQEKLNAHVGVPEELDLERYRAAPQSPDEVPLPDDAPSGSGPQVDEGALNQLLAMGFPEVRCRKALIKTGNNGADVAMNWLFEHMEDADIDDPIQSAPVGGSGASEADLSQLMDMGFTKEQAARALKETGNDMNRAVDWLFSHADSFPADEGSGGSAAASAAPDNRPAKYHLSSFISHKGTSTHAGHYVVHIKRDGRWVLYNDNKVVEVPNVESAIGEAYIYVFQRV